MTLITYVRFVAIKEMSAGNETIGEMWKETKIFHENTPLREVMEWAGIRKNVVITTPENSEEELRKRMET